MRFSETHIKGVYVLETVPHVDHRGFFARTFCVEEFKAYGLQTTVAQCSFAFTQRAGTVRGMHYQVAPATEVKLVRCIRGSIYDVVADMRPDSPTYLQHVGVELSADNRRSLYVPEMFAHGYQSLTDVTEVLYQMNELYVPECQRGIRHDDPLLGIRWPLRATDLSEKDASWPLLVSERRHGS